MLAFIEARRRRRRPPPLKHVGYVYVCYVTRERPRQYKSRSRSSFKAEIDRRSSNKEQPRSLRLVIPPPRDSDLSARQSVDRRHG